MAPETSLPKSIIQDWKVQLRHFKEQLAKRLWALPSISESEKEILYREYLVDLDRFENELQKNVENENAQVSVLKDENDLLRSLLGIPDDELRSRVFVANQEAQQLKNDLNEARQELEASENQLTERTEENEILRKKVYELEQKADQFRAEQLRLREDDIQYFSGVNQDVKRQMKDLETQVGNLKEMFAETNETMLREKQEEITNLQMKLIEDMEKAIHTRQELVWKEEEMFSRGVAHRLRTALVSVQGQLYLTLERMGLLDPETKNEAFWRARFNLLVHGAQELSENFKAIHSQLQDVTQALDDFLHLTHKHEMVWAPVSMPALVEKELAEVYADRKTTLNIEFLPDDPLPDVEGDAGLLRFVVSQLLRNAVESIPNETGRISILVKNRSDKNRVYVVVEDTGNGIPDFIQPRLFEPFLTTKKEHQGLSLSRARRYCEMHGGTLTLLKTSPEGTSFQMEIPCRRTVG